MLCFHLIIDIFDNKFALLHKTESRKKIDQYKLLDNNLC